MATKLCKICDQVKEFAANKNTKDGLQTRCKDCIKLYRKSNGEKYNLTNHKYYEDNKERLSKKHRENYRKNIENNREYSKQHYRNNLEYYKKRNRNYTRNRVKTDVVFKLRLSVSTTVNTALKTIGSSKKGQSILHYLPYTIQQLKQHLETQFEPWMNWDNQGRYKPDSWNESDQTTWAWNIDHIVPQSLLPYASMQDENFKKCWALENLRPLSAKQNVLDGVNKIRHKEYK